MGLGDKMEELADKAKAKMSGATDNPDLEAEGRKEEAEPRVEQTGDSVADALRDASGAMKGDTIRDEER
jgi:uncharacterized protein YjbJ (UPF0337 family)